MIKFFSDFASSLVASIISITMIEILLPNGKSKKYVTFVAAMILSIVIINPLISLLNNDINIEKFLNEETGNFEHNEYTAKMEYAKQKSIDEMYDESLRKDIVKRLEENGYIVKSMYLDVDRKTYEPIKIGVEIEHDDGDIQKVVIDVSNSYSNDISLFEIAKIKDDFNLTYNIDRKSISINGK